MFHSYAAIGDSFTEGVGDELPDGTVRGWADFVALGLAAAAREPVRYANLAIRGRKLGPIVDEQLEAAIALRPEVISFNGGGNDMLRPRMPEERNAAPTPVSTPQPTSAARSNGISLSMRTTEFSCTSIFSA